MGLAATHPGALPFFCPNGDHLTQPPPAHMGIPPYGALDAGKAAGEYSWPTASRGQQSPPHPAPAHWKRLLAAAASTGQPCPQNGYGFQKSLSVLSIRHSEDGLVYHLYVSITDMFHLCLTISTRYPRKFILWRLPNIMAELWRLLSFVKQNTNIKATPFSMVVIKIHYQFKRPNDLDANKLISIFTSFVLLDLQKKQQTKSLWGLRN